jgi:regulator of sigma E protease
VSLLGYLVAVIPMLGILIFVHELGHFLVAKACGVRVLKFSLGFGPPVGLGRFRLRWERGGTEYVVAWFPLGGFVKMLGENMHLQGEDPEEAVVDARPEEFLTAKPTWQKLAIVFAGPTMNLLLPVLAFAGLLAYGVPRPAAVVGTVEPGSPAAELGIHPGDRILSVDARPVQWWDDVEEAVRSRTSGDVALHVARAGKQVDFSVPVRPRSGLDEFGESTPTGWIGIEHWRLPALLGVPSDDSAAARAGLRSGDRVTAVAGRPVEDWEGFRAAYASATGGPVELAVAREGAEEPVAVRVPALGGVQRLGVVPATVLVDEVDPDLPAGKAGLQSGDLILSVDGRFVGTFASFQETVRASQGRSLAITYSRAGELHEVSLTPQLRDVEGALGIEERVYLIGIRKQPTLLPGETAVEQVWNPALALARGASTTVEKTGQYLRGLAKIATGEIGRDKLAGPIGIAEIARKSLDLGWQYYLYTMIFISINLGILNLLPIPILDGGQALIFLVEGVKRAPISLRTREIVQHLGLTVILMLMGLAFWNDISRNWSKFVDWLTGGS